MIEELRKIVIDKLSCSAHDLQHVFRVYNNCLRIARTEENVDLEVLKVACLLHDIARVEEDNCLDRTIDHAILGAEISKGILQKLGKDEIFIEKVCSAIRTHRFRGNLIPKSLEAKILFDADKLDTIGYIGICRSYMFAGQVHQDLYNGCNLNEYIETNLIGGDEKGKIIDLSKHTPNIEFKLKNIKIPDKMFTAEGKRIAKIRIQLMADFYEKLEKEIKGEDSIK